MKHKKYYFKTRNEDECIEKCNVQNNGIMIGSYSCTRCEFHFGNDADPEDEWSDMRWIKCSRLDEAIKKIKAGS